MKRFNAEAPITRLRIEQKSLNSKLNQLRREITYETSTERKRRAIIKQISSTEKNIKDIDKLILEEKKSAVKQYTSKFDTMLTSTSLILYM